jgi:predicted kinase
MEDAEPQHPLRLYLIRGLPGSGKSELAKVLTTNRGKAYSADDFFEKSGVYFFDPALLPEAHAECRENVKKSMELKYRLIVVHNTLSKRWEADPYFALAKKFGYTVAVVECQSNFGNIHKCPDDKILKMIERWEPLV